MILQQRIELLIRLGEYMSSQDDEWLAYKRKASIANQWFIPEFVDLAVQNITAEYLQPDKLHEFISAYPVADPPEKKDVGIVMAGNIPMVGFHDLMCVFLSGHNALIKPSSRDDVLIPFLVKMLTRWNSEVAEYMSVRELLKGCDAYIATGSGNTAVHFAYYFRNQPHIIRSNRTSVAILDGTESEDDLARLADDVHLYFGLGCRNVTQILVPEGYDFLPLLKAFERYKHLINHNKYKNNYDYQLALHMLNKRKYMTNDSILLVEDESPFSAISQLHYIFYQHAETEKERLLKDDRIQAVVGRSSIPFGKSQCPGVCTFADGVDTMMFLLSLQHISQEVRRP